MEPCVHCGFPINYVPRGESEFNYVHRFGVLACPNGSGHIACPAQGGVE